MRGNHALGYPCRQVSASREDEFGGLAAQYSYHLFATIHFHLPQLPQSLHTCLKMYRNRQAIQLHQKSQVLIHKYRRNRKMPACEPCRKSKVACNHAIPCSRCIKRRRVEECFYHPSPLTRVSSPCHAIDVRVLLPQSLADLTCPIEWTGRHKFASSKRHPDIARADECCPELAN